MTIDNERDELLKISSIYDTINPTIKKKCKDPATINKIIKVFQEFSAKNEKKLLTPIMGRQVLVNEKMENDIFSIFGLDKKDVKDTILNSEYFIKQFGRELSLTNQLCLAVPLIFAALEYGKLGKKEYSEICYLLCFFKPYASRESVFFKYGVNESQMQYTVEHLSDRFYLKKYGTVFGAIKARAESSYDNYIAPKVKSKDIITDSEFVIIYQSGIATYMNALIGKVVEKYIENKGKSLDFEDATASFTDRDTNQTDYMERDIESDAAVKEAVVNRVIMAVLKDPIDKKIEAIACHVGFDGSKNYDIYIPVLHTIISYTTDKMIKELPLFFSSFIGSFLFHRDLATGKLYTMKEFGTPKFLEAGVDILVGKKSHLTDKSTVTARALFKKMLEEYSVEYNTKGTTYQRQLTKALAAYWTYLVYTKGRK